MLLRILKAGMLVLAFCASTVFAETEPAAPIDFASWDKLATQAEEIVNVAEISDANFQVLREKLVVWRQSFAKTKDGNVGRIDTLKQQIAALGAVPADPTTEPAEIANRRADLTKQLAEIEAPAIRATEAYSQVDGLITEIDKVLRARQTGKLFVKTNSPLAVSNWAPSIGTLVSSFWAIVTEASEVFVQPELWSNVMGNWEQIALLLAVCLAFLLRGRSWAIWAADRVHELNFRGHCTVGFLVSIGQVILPYVCLLALLKAMTLAGIVGPKGQVVVDVFAQAALYFLISFWMGKRIFTSHDGIAVFEVSKRRSRQGRFATGVVGFVFAARMILDAVIAAEGIPNDQVVVLLFPLTVVASVCLLVISGILLTHVKHSKNEDKSQNTRDRVIKTLGRAGFVIAFAAPILAILGYSNAAEALVYPALVTLGLMAFVSLVQRLVDDIYTMITGKISHTEQGLLPVLIRFTIALASVPVLALIWGAQINDITEIWTRFLNGVSLGNTRISPSVLLSLIGVFLIGYFVTRLLQSTLRTSILPKTRIDTGGQNAIISGLGYLGIFASLFIAISAAGIDLSSLAIVAGALSVGIGFGLQNIVSNFVSGIILLIERPVAEGDWIDVANYSGIVTAISVRSTRIETFDKLEVIVPNSDLISGTVINWTRNSLMGRVIVPVGVAYGTDTRKVENILMEIAEAHPMVLEDQPIRIFLQTFGADSLNFEIRAIIRDVFYVAIVKSDLNHEIVRRFAEEGIGIPFPQRDLWIRNPEDLRPSPAARKSTKAIPSA